MTARRIYCFEHTSQYAASSATPWEAVMQAPAWERFQGAVAPRHRGYFNWTCDRIQANARACRELLASLRERDDYAAPLTDLYWRTWRDSEASAMRSVNAALRSLRKRPRATGRRRAWRRDTMYGPSETGFGSLYDKVLFETWVWMAREMRIKWDWRFYGYLIDDTPRDDASSSECYSPDPY